MASEKKEFGRYKDVRCDLGTFVIAADKLKKKGRPFTIIFNVAVSIIRWRYPLLSLVAIPLILLMVVFWPEYFIALFLVPIPMLSLAELVKKLGTRKPSLNDYNHLFKRKDETPEMLAKKAAMLKAQQHLQMYLEILIYIQQLCADMSNKLDIFYSLVNCESWKHSLLFHFIILNIIGGLFLLETRFLVAIILFFAAIFNPGFKQALKDCFFLFYNLPSKLRSLKEKPLTDLSDDDTFEDIEQKDFDMQIKEEEPVNEDEVSSGSSSDSEDFASKPETKFVQTIEPLQERQRERTGLSFVSKLASITRRRKKQGNCASCKVEFSTILKKRNYCRHCGSSYCSKCCNQRVPKVVFGATAPAAYEERVLVCQSCYAFLMNRMRGTNTEIVE